MGIGPYTEKLTAQEQQLNFMNHLVTSKQLDHNVVAVYGRGTASQSAFFKFGAYDQGAGKTDPVIIRTFHKATWITQADNVYIKMQKVLFAGKSNILVIFEPQLPFIYVP